MREMRLRTSAHSLGSKADHLTPEFPLLLLSLIHSGWASRRELLHALNWASPLLYIGPSFSLSQPGLDGSGWEAKINVWRLPSGGRYEYSGICALWRPQVGC